MQGEWALTLDVSGPLRDRLVKKLQLGEMGAMKHDGGMKHDGSLKHDEAKPESQ
jgi:hypothetical protein